MRTLMICISVMVGLPVVARANVPGKFSVQGVLRDDVGKLQTTMVNVTVALYDASVGGNKLAGSYGPTSVMATNGLFTFPFKIQICQQN